MNRGWVIAGLVALAIGLAALVGLQPSRAPVSPEARAMGQLRAASTRDPQVSFVRASAGDPRIVCGLVTVRGYGGLEEPGAFVSTPQRVVVGRFGNPALMQALDQHCQGMFPVEPPPVS